MSNLISPAKSSWRINLASIFCKNKEGYYLALLQTQATLNSDAPDWQPWLTFFLRALHTQMQRLAAKVERERLLQHALPDLSRRIVEHAREHGRVTIKEMTLLTGTSRNTLKEHFQRLLENGMLERNGQGRGVWYRVK